MMGQAVRVHRLIEAERKRLLTENTQLRQELKERYDCRTSSAPAGRCSRSTSRWPRWRRPNTTVLIRGESGTGKELIAHAIHYNSPRAEKPFVKVSCAALPESLIESELFGYEKGAFTGAQARKKGRFELADGGTLFLDEVGELNLATQVKLLRVLQEREFERLGGTRPIKVNVRLIAATNQDLETAIARGHVPRGPLLPPQRLHDLRAAAARAARPDILLLADHFVEKYARRARQDDQAHRHRRHRHADELPLAGQRPRAGELHRARRAGLRRRGHPRPPPAADAADGGGLGHAAPRRRSTDAVGGYEKDLILDALKTTRGNRAQGRAAPRHHGADHRLQGPEVRHRVRAVPRSAVALLPPGGGPGPAESGVRGLTPKRPNRLTPRPSAVLLRHATPSVFHQRHIGRVLRSSCR